MVNAKVEYRYGASGVLPDTSIYASHCATYDEGNQKMSYFYIIPALGIVLGYTYFFYRRAQVKKAGGDEVYSRVRLNKLFQLPEGESVTAAWEAVTIPKKSAGEKAVEAVGVAAAVVMGVGVRIVGRPLGVACTTENRVLLL